jgi:DNA repair protein RecO (recombination protein O)
MKTEITPAIIMRVKEIGESDLLVSFFTPHRGQLKGVAKGARKSRQRFVNALALFSMVSLEYSPRRQGNLHLLHSGKLLQSYPGLSSGFLSLSLASYMIELTDVLFPPGVTESRMFELLNRSFDALSRGEKVDLVPLVFEFKAMSLGGYRIEIARCAKCGRPYKGEGTAVFKRESGGIACLRCERVSVFSSPLRPESVRAIEILQDRPFEEASGLNLDQDVIRELKAVLKQHREYRLEQKLRTSKYVD